MVNEYPDNFPAPPAARCSFWSPLVSSSLAQGCGRTAEELGGAMGCRGLPSLTWSRPRPLLVNWSVPSATLTPDASEK